jgi:GntR family transcriptional regulator / MocR family aminotransferase
MKRATSPPELVIPLTSKADAPLRLQLERGLRHAVQTGRLPVGALLPSTRVLAGDLGISRGVVLEAYEQLIAEGYLIARRGSATRVGARGAERGSASATDSISKAVYRYDFRPGVPDISLFPRRAWLISMRRAVGAAAHIAFDYPDPRGAESARARLSAYLNRTRATVTRSDHMLLCTGFAQGIRLVCQVLRERGVRRIAVEDPGAIDQCADIDAEGLEKVRVPVDNDGLRTDLLRETHAGAVLVTPAHQYPTGAVLAPHRRAALLDWASQRRAVIIEDDYDAEYRYDREPIGSLQGLAPDHVIYMGTASKTLSPALRLAWLALPPDFIEDVARAKLHADRGSPALDQLALADFLDRGELDRHLRKSRLIYRRRRDKLVAALGTHLPHLRPRGVAAGLHLMIELGRGADEQQIVEAAARRSIRLYGASSYRAVPATGPPALLLGYGALEENVVEEAVRHLASLLQKHSL